MPFTDLARRCGALLDGAGALAIGWLRTTPSNLPPAGGPTSSVEPEARSTAMRETHPSREDLERFMRGELSFQENLEMLLHLLPGCALCQEVTQGQWDIGMRKRERSQPIEDVGRTGYEAAVERAFALVGRKSAALEVERREAAGLFAELARHPFERRRLLIENSARFRNWGLCELLLHKSEEGRFGEPREVEAWAELAVAVTATLSRDDYPTELIEDLKARAWGCVGNARRILSDFRSAEQAFLAAESHLAKGTGDRLSKARLLDLQASLRNSQQRHEEAVRLLDRAVAIYRRAGQRHLLGRTLINKGHVWVCAGEPEAAISVLRQGLALADAEHEPRLVLTAQHNLAYLLNEIGRHVEALSLLSRGRALYAQCGERMDFVRLRYLEGKIAVSMGRQEQAESALKEAKDGFVAAEMGYYAALVSLDLAEIFAGQGRRQEMRDLSEEMVSIFQSRDVHREALAALILFRKAVEAEDVTVALLREISARLRRGPGAPVGASF